MIAGCPADTNRVFGLNCKFLLTFKFAWQHFGCRPGLSYLMFSQPRAKRKGAANCQAAGCVHMCSGWVWVLGTGECVLTGFKIVLIKPGIAAHCCRSQPASWPAPNSLFQPGSFNIQHIFKCLGAEKFRDPKSMQRKKEIAIRKLSRYCCSSC